MNDREKYGASELLSGLDEKELLDLAKTVTKAKFIPQNKRGNYYLVNLWKIIP